MLYDRLYHNLIQGPWTFQNNRYVSLSLFVLEAPFWILFLALHVEVEMYKRTVKLSWQSLWTGSLAGQCLSASRKHPVTVLVTQWSCSPGSPGDGNSVPTVPSWVLPRPDLVPDTSSRCSTKYVSYMDQNVAEPLRKVNDILDENPCDINQACPVWSSPVLNSYVKILFLSHS